MLCPFCKKETSSGSRFCHHCGRRLLRSRSSGGGDGTLVMKESTHDKMTREEEDGASAAGFGAPGKMSGSTGKTEVDGGYGGPLHGESFDHEEEILRDLLAGRYTIIRKLGTGNMASVFLAREHSLDRDVAIKVLPQSFLRDRHFILRFKREARIAARLEHPSIVRIFQISEEPRLCYIVMSYIPGGSLSEQIEKHGPLTTEKAVLWAMDITSALAYAHEQGIIHRDLKSDNIMIDKNTRAVVMDFGIARAKEDPALTLSHSLIGTPLYMSPEQAQGMEIDARSDIYSIGVILYQMVTGNVPFDADDLRSVIYMHINKQPEAPKKRNAKVPGRLNDIILTCLRKDPPERFPSARALREALAGLHGFGTGCSLSGEKSTGGAARVREKILWHPLRQEDIPAKTRGLMDKLIDEIPGLPVHVHKLLGMVSGEEVDIKQVVNSLSTDPGLVTTILKMANSSYYGLSKKTSSLHFAVVRIGMRDLRRIIIRSCLPEGITKGWSYKGYDTRRLWEHSYYVSVCAEALAMEKAPKQVANLMTMGLLHDLGKFPLFRLALLFSKKGLAPPNVDKAAVAEHLLAKEEHMFYVNHTIIGAALAEKWKFSDRICSAIEYHHYPSFFDINLIPLEYARDIALISIADLMVNYLKTPGKKLPEPEPEFFDLAGLEPPIANAVTPGIREKIDHAGELLAFMG